MISLILFANWISALYFLIIIGINLKMFELMICIVYSMCSDTINYYCYYYYYYYYYYCYFYYYSYSYSYYYYNFSTLSNMLSI